MKDHLYILGMKTGSVYTGPQTVHIDITNACNTNCVTCWDHSPSLKTPRSQDWKKQQMSWEMFDALTQDIARMNSVKAVILSGMGEPFLNPYIYQMIAQCKEYGWHTTVLTNSLKCDPGRVLASDVDMLLISVNGVTPKSYTAFHPNLTPKDFERLCEILGEFASAGKRFKQVQVIISENYQELVEMVKFAHNYQASQITFKLASLGEGTEIWTISNKQREELLTLLIPLAKNMAKKLEVKTNLDVFEQQVAIGSLATAPIESIGCYMGWVYSRITVDGTILYCCSKEVVVGSLTEAPFSQHWYGKKWQELRERLRSGNYFNSCYQCGKLNQNFKWKQRVEAEST